MMLRDSEGIVSVARGGGGPAPGRPMLDDAPAGASFTFWVVSLLIGVAVGALAYIIALQA